MVADLVNISHEAWEKYAEIIAAEVSDEIWEQLLSARQAMELLNNIRNQAQQAKHVNLFLKPQLVERYTQLANEIKTGRDALNSLLFPDSYLAIPRRPRQDRKRQDHLFAIVVS